MSKRSETMQTPKARSGTSEVPPQRVSPRAARQLRPTLLDTDSASSSSTQTTRIPKERSPKVIERKSPRSPVPEKRRPSRISELESQIGQLQEELKEAREQLCRSESGRREAELEAEDSKRRASSLSSKLDELRELSSSEEGRLSELQRISEERDQALRCELDSLHKHRSVDSAALASASDELHWLKLHLETSSVSDAREIQSLRADLSEKLSLLEAMSARLSESKDSEAETLLRLEAARAAVESLRLEAARAAESRGSMASELAESRARIAFLEGLVGDRDGDELRSAMEEQIKSTVEMRSARELVERVKAESGERESELRRAGAEIEELRANLMDKETELQGISEENEELRAGLEREAAAAAAGLRSELMEKETEVMSLGEENRALKSEVARVKVSLESARGSEREALGRLGAAAEEAERVGKRAARVVEQLDAAQAARAEMEAELRRIKVQSDQWRKAAEAAAAMLSAGNNNNNNTNNGKYVERSGSMDSKYSPGPGKFNSLYSDDIVDDDADDDLLKKKNGNVLKKIGVLWKKPHK